MVCGGIPGELREAPAEVPFVIYYVNVCGGAPEELRELSGKVPVVIHYVKMCRGAPGELWEVPGEVPFVIHYVNVCGGAPGELREAPGERSVIKYGEVCREGLGRPCGGLASFGWFHPCKCRHSRLQMFSSS